jgi:hypothetical protein
MSRKRREAMEAQSIAVSNENERASPGSVASGWWSGLSTGKRWGALVALLFVALGIFGAGLKYLEDSGSFSAKNNGFLFNLNPFPPPPTPTPTPLPLSKQYIYAGSRLLAVKDAGVDMPAPSDLTVWRPSSGVWYCLGGPGSQSFSVAWGNGSLGDVPVPGDYDGDTKTDLAI